MIESISAVTLATHDMSRAVHFYRALGFEIVHGGEEAEFTSFRAGTSFLNLIARPRRKAGLGGARHFLSFRHRHSLCGRDCGRVSPQLGAARRQMGRAVLSPHRSGWSPTELRFATGDVLSQKHENASGPHRVKLRHLCLGTKGRLHPRDQTLRKLHE
jgi:catechol 2,3-dioxygenase-like lactoylglutathione lyase family enzyme